jgi:hypothetical protein
MLISASGEPWKWALGRCRATNTKNLRLAYCKRPQPAPDHVIVVGEARLRRILAAYIEHHNAARISGLPRMLQIAGPSRDAAPIAVPALGGLHHRDARIVSGRDNRRWTTTRPTDLQPAISNAPASVPELASLVLFGSGLVGLGFLRFLPASEQHPLAANGLRTGSRLELTLRDQGNPNIFLIDRTP